MGLDISSVADQVPANVRLGRRSHSGTYLWAIASAVFVMSVAFMGTRLLGAQHPDALHGFTPSLATAPDPAVDYGSADAVCDAFVRALLTTDTRLDRAPTNAFARTGPYVTMRLLITLLQLPVGPLWQDWTRRQVHTVVSTSASTDDGTLGDRRLNGYRTVFVTPIGVDGWQGFTTRSTAHCELLPVPGNGLRVNAYRLEMTAVYQDTSVDPSGKPDRSAPSPSTSRSPRPWTPQAGRVRAEQ